MFELTHDGGLSQEVCPSLVARAGLQGFNGDTKYQRVSNFYQYPGMTLTACPVSLAGSVSPGRRLRTLPLR